MNKNFQPLLAPATLPPAVPAAPATPPTPGHTPQVTLKRDGDRVTHITVHCACGEHIELACEY